MKRSPKCVFWFALFSLGVVFFLGGALYFSLASKVYRATAHVSVTHIDKEASPDSRSNGSFTDVDASFVENEAHLMLSPQVLYEVVSRLQLTDPENSEPLRSDLRNMARICRRLKQRIAVRRIPNTCLLEIQVAWRDGNGAAKIANEIAAAFSKAAGRLGPRTIAFEIDDSKKNLTSLDHIIASQQDRVLQLQLDVKASRSDRLRYFFENGYLNALKRRRETISNQVDNLQSESMRASALAYEAETDLADPPQRPVWPNGRSALFCIVSGLLLSAGGCWKMKCSRDDNPGRAVEHVQLK